MNIFETEDLFKNSAIVFGNEGAGISSSSEGIAVGIPMPGGTESLNVAQAATILLFESVRRGEC
jgi:TrmH family RNA methyltransferase